MLELTGERLSVLQRRTEPAPFAMAAFALMPRDRAQLYAKIDQRFTEMMAEGFLDEVRALKARGDLDAELPSLRSVGYRQLWAHLEGTCGLPEAVAAGQRATRNLAKRQLTWLRSEPSWIGIPSLEEQELVPILRVMSSVTAR
mgnify:FL=1